MGSELNEGGLSDAGVPICAEWFTSRRKAGGSLIYRAFALLMIVAIIAGFAVGTVPERADALNAVLCGIPAKDGAAPTYTSGVPNSYWTGTGGTLALSAGQANTTLTLGAINPNGSQTGLTAGDLILIYQTQGAYINTSNTSAYGDGSTGTGITGTPNAGTYEYARVVSVSGGGSTGSTVTIYGAGSNGGLLHNYFNTAYFTQGGSTSGVINYQVVRVPQYGNYTVGAKLYTAPWNGASGGIIALDVAGQLTLTNPINADGYGFRGGGQNTFGNYDGGGSGGASSTTSNGAPATDTATGADGATNDDYRFAPTLAADTYTDATINVVRTGGPDGFKGEGIVGTPSWVYASGASSPIFAPSTISSFSGDGTSSGYPGGSKGRGAPGNAGGGANDGEASGYNHLVKSPSITINGTVYYFWPNGYNAGGGGGANGGAGGIGGEDWIGLQSPAPQPSGTTAAQGLGGAALTSSASAVFFGGGGGAGSNNDGSAGTKSVTVGGGITFVPTSASASSGGSGGGLVMLRIGSVSSGTITANGISAPDPDNDGGGGGGGGGTVMITGTGTVTASVSANGGLGANSTGGNGETTTFDANGQNQGQYAYHGPGGGGGGGVVLSSGGGVTASVTGGTAGYTADHNPPATTVGNYYATAGSAGKTYTGIAPTAINGVRSGAECALLLLAKRYTKVISGGTTTAYTTYMSDSYTDADSNTPVDSDPLWPQSGGSPAIFGSVGGSTFYSNPGDTLEYAIYFLSAGGLAVTNPAVCDFVPPDQTIVSAAYTNAGTNYGMKVTIGYGGTPTVTYFNAPASSGATGIYPVSPTTGTGSLYALPSVCGTAPKSSVTGNYATAAVYYAGSSLPSNVSTFGSTNLGYGFLAYQSKTS
jgi:uncharacterized repeat protein (TIGR01451 family)